MYMYMKTLICAISDNWIDIFVICLFATLSCRRSHKRKRCAIQRQASVILKIYQQPVAAWLALGQLWMSVVRGRMQQQLMKISVRTGAQLLDHHLRWATLV